VRLESVGKRYGLRQPWVVRDVSLDVPAGRLIRLEGRNGSGKSTLLRVAAGVSWPSTGRVTGRPSVGYVPERFPGRLAFSARDYLLHLGRVHGLRGESVGARVDEWLDRLGAAGFAAAPLRSLSKGMCQKVAVAQALMPRPGLLVLDEAWTGLDQAARGALDAAVAERVADGGTVMFVDHDQARLAGQIDERWQLDGGRVGVVPGGGRARAATLAGVMVIELAGLDGESLTRLGALPGVLSTSAEAPASGTAPAGRAPPGTPPAGAGSRVAVRVEAAQSDPLLRHLLTWDGVHVAAVRPEAESGAAAAGTGTGSGTGGTGGTESAAMGPPQ
jgi:ABC-2 type transport system ATP-binding protein